MSFRCPQMSNSAPLSNLVTGADNGFQPEVTGECFGMRCPVLRFIIFCQLVAPNVRFVKALTVVGG